VGLTSAGHLLSYESAGLTGGRFEGLGEPVERIFSDWRRSGGKQSRFSGVLGGNLVGNKWS